MIFFSHVKNHLMAVLSERANIFDKNGFAGGTNQLAILLRKKQENLSLL